MLMTALGIRLALIASAIFNVIVLLQKRTIAFLALVIWGRVYVVSRIRTVAVDC